MARQFISRRNIDFLLYEVLHTEELSRYDVFGDHSRDTFDLVIDTVSKLAGEMMYPVFQEMDSNPPVFKDGMARVHPIVPRFMQACGEGGWVNPVMSYADGGQQLPVVINSVFSFIIAAGNYSLSAYLQLTTGAANLLAAFGSDSLKSQYLAPMLAGKWQGTMALTEPGAGSSLADLRTQAEETPEGYYRMKGQKIFITAGSTDATANTVHMMLARIKGAPAGVKGISLFVVPRLRMNQAGELEANDIECAGIEHKLGYKGCPACQLVMGDNNDCRGYLVGRPGMGLAYMFQMMNEERVNVGIGAAAKATAAYYSSLEYCRQRLQGRSLSDKNPDTPQIPIIEHQDIKRLLLFQRAVSEGALALALQVSLYMDLARAGVDHEDNELLADFLVPIVKSYPSEMGVLSTSAAIQCLGGYGYCRDFPVEQYFRDVRIDPIHEGTTGIQGQDLLGRKISMKGGRAYSLFQDEVRKTISKASMIGELKYYAYDLETALNLMDEVNRHLQNYRQQGLQDAFLGDASLFLELAGIVAIAWQWLQQGVVSCKALEECGEEGDAAFYQGKLAALDYYYHYELPRLDALRRTLTRGRALLANVPVYTFVD